VCVYRRNRRTPPKSPASRRSERRVDGGRGKFIGSVIIMMFTGSHAKKRSSSSTSHKRFLSQERQHAAERVDRNRFSCQEVQQSDDRVSHNPSIISRHQVLNPVAPPFKSTRHPFNSNSIPAASGCRMNGHRHLSIEQQSKQIAKITDLRGRVGVAPGGWLHRTQIGHIPTVEDV
jgi:hypothetical protein